MLRAGLRTVLIGLVLSAQVFAAERSEPVHRDPGTGLSYRLAGAEGQVVVCESATAEPMANWDDVASALAPCARVLTYDRLGTGASAALSGSRVRGDDVAVRLHRLLRDLHLPTPVILVGHSIGGLYAQIFARRFPREVVGVVLVDAASPLEPPGVFVPSSPPPAGTTAAAEEAGVSETMDALRHGPDFPPVPLIVLSATKHDDTTDREALWQEIQERTARLSPRGQRVVVESGHFIQRDRPEAVAAAIRSLACR